MRRITDRLAWRAVVGGIAGGLALTVGVGVARFPSPVVARVRIEYGNQPLGPNDSARVDVAVMDNLIYAEPQPAL